MLPMDLENRYFSEDKGELFAALRKAYPDPKDLKLVLPFTTFVSNASSLQWTAQFKQGYDVN